MLFRHALEAESFESHASGAWLTWKKDMLTIMELDYNSGRKLLQR